MPKRIHPVILAGGSGTRFWPLSRRRKPKQLLPLTSNKPLITETFDRVASLASSADVLVVCGQSHAGAIRRALPKVPAKNLLVEPAARNTAPAIGLAALAVARRDPHGVLLVLPSDHAISEGPGFARTVAAAVAAAEKGALVSIGVRPTRPETGYGYIKVGEVYPKEKRAKKVLTFVEKPDRARAETYLGAGDYLWNAGMFAFRADRILEELRQHLPACAKALERIGPHLGTRGQGRALARHFSDCPSISIDYAVMEKASDLAIVPAEFSWSDVGSFATVPEVRSHDESGNVVDGETVIVDARDNVVLGQKRRVVALVGVSDLIVVDSGDALLVCHRDRAQDVRKVVEELEDRGEDRLL